MARGGQLENPVKIVPASAAAATASVSDAGARPRSDGASEPAGSVHSLGHGRSLALVPAQDAGAAGAEAIEIRGQGGMLELRIRITDTGPVLEMEGIRLAVTAAESIELKSRRVVVEAEESLTLASRGRADLLAQDKIHVRTREYLGLDGKLVGLRSDERTIVRELAEREFGGDIEKCLTWLAEHAPAVDW
jgi:hypothetical protein